MIVDSLFYPKQKNKNKWWAHENEMPKQKNGKNFWKKGALSCLDASGAMIKELDPEK